MAAAVAAPTQNPEREFEVTPAPTDGITALRIQDNRYLIASSWDTKVRLYDITSPSGVKVVLQHKAAVLDCVFLDKNRVVTVGIDRTVKLFDLSTGAETLIGTHDKAVKCVEYSPSSGQLITGSWDTFIKLWDTRSDFKCIGTYKQPERVYTMGVAQDKLVCGTAGRHVHIYDLKFMKEPQQRRESSLKYQTRCIRCFPNGTGYALSSIEGRVAMEYFDPGPEAQAKRYAFKCHRVSQNGIDTIYPVNTMAFHQGHGTFATGGCDGIVNVWDGQNRKRLWQYHKYPTSISALAFSENGSWLAVASSYTFEEGEKDHPEDQIFVRQINESEVMPKQKGTQ
jgi:cell cycle arrest protein BUB3